MGDVKKIYLVDFKTPPVEGDEETQFFFTSVASIFDYFTPKQIGCGKHRLYDLGAAKGRRVETSKCVVSRLRVLTSRDTITIRETTGYRIEKY